MFTCKTPKYYRLDYLHQNKVVCLNGRLSPFISTGPLFNTARLLKHVAFRHTAETDQTAETQPRALCSASFSESKRLRTWWLTWPAHRAANRQQRSRGQPRVHGDTLHLVAPSFEPRVTSTGQKHTGYEQRSIVKWSVAVPFRLPSSPTAARTARGCPRGSPPGS